MLDQKYSKNRKKAKPANYVMTKDLPPIPEKLYITIGEVSEACYLRPHVLRYWEQEFPQLNPSKRRGNRRYYQRKDVVLIRNIRELLYDQGYTIEGARVQLSAVKSKKVNKLDSRRRAVSQTVSDLENILNELEKDGV